MISKELKSLEDTLWRTADQLRANSSLKSHEYSVPVLGLISLKFADNKFSAVYDEVDAAFKRLANTRRARMFEEIAIERCGFYLPDGAPELEAVIGKNIRLIAEGE